MGALNTDMDNFTTVKVNPYEIAKASDMDSGFKNILSNLSIFVDRFFGYHRPELTDTLFDFPTNVDKSRKDFIIGGGLVAASDLKKIGLHAQRILRPLPMVAFSSAGGVFVTNGLNVDNRPFHIPIGEDFYEEGYRIESVYISNADDDEHIHGTGKKKKDPNWDEFQSETRASYRISGTSDETVFSTFYKRQMQAVRFYVLHGMIAFEKKDARAADTPHEEPWNARVKIAEVLVQCKQHSDEILYIQPIEHDDVRFVTAVQYAEHTDTAKYADAPWVAHAKRVHPVYPPDATFKEKERLDEKAAQQTEQNKAYRAEHYNYRWTNEHTRTYRLGSIAEINERLYAFHKTDGSLKEAIVRHEHINLQSEDNNSLKGSLIPVDSPSQNIPLPFGGQIISHQSIKTGLLAVAKALLQADEKIDSVDNRLNTKIDKVDAQVNKKIDEHSTQNDAHGATSSPTANRLALRDTYGRFEVENPVSDKQAVNISYLNSTFKMDIVMKVLQSKYITAQSEFDTWINQKKNESYTYVYLKGKFLAEHPIGLNTIGTKELIGLGTASIEIMVLPDNKWSDAGMYGYLKEKVDNITITVTGHIEQALPKEGQPGKYVDGVVGFQGLKCTNCTANVKGSDGKTGGHGAAAVGFSHCTVDACSVHVRGGNGGRGGDGVTSTDFLGCCSGSDGGRGGNGGDAISVKSCTFMSPLKKEAAYAGNGGDGGNGGYGNCAGQHNGGGGNGGHGGNAYVVNLRNGTKGLKGHFGWQGGWRDRWTKRRGNGSDGVDGRVIQL